MFLQEYCAAYSSKLWNIRGASVQLRTNRETLTRYFEVLKAMFLLDLVPAWIPKDYDYPGKTPKLFFCDSGLAAHLLNIHTIDDFFRDSRFAGDLIGKLVETWVYNQLIPEVELHPRWKIYQFRGANEKEIDFLVVNEQEDILGIEVKTSQSLASGDFKHLCWFPSLKSMQERKFTGIVLYAGNNVFRWGDGQTLPLMYGIPMAYLWQPFE